MNARISPRERQHLDDKSLARLNAFERDEIPRSAHQDFAREAERHAWVNQLTNDEFKLAARCVKLHREDQDLRNEGV